MHRRKNRIVWALGRAATGIFWGLLLLLLLASAGTALADGSHIPIEAPVVLSYTPEADAVQFPVNGVITVVWDRPMLSDTNFRVTGPEGFVPGSFFYNPNVYTVTFIPDQNFAPDTRYGVLVAGNVHVSVQIEIRGGGSKDRRYLRLPGKGNDFKGVSPIQEHAGSQPIRPNGLEGIHFVSQQF
jgi:hypothetical protein